jgi:hypothetical protein
MQTAVTVAGGACVMEGVLLGETVEVGGGVDGVLQEERTIANNMGYMIFILCSVYTRLKIIFIEYSMRQIKTRPDQGVFAFMIYIPGTS